MGPADREEMRAALEAAALDLESTRDAYTAALAAARPLAVKARAQGWPVEAIAGALRVTRTTVSKWLNRDAEG